MYFKVVIESGHVGAGKSWQDVFYVEADSADDLLTMIKDCPGLKSKESFGTLSMVTPVDKQEFEREKVLEWKRRYISRLHV